MALHYSEDPTIDEFVPHVPATNPDTPPLVWAIEPAYAPLYWFPATAHGVAVWANDDVGQRRLAARFDTVARRVQWAWRRDEASVRSTQLTEYTFDAEPFDAWPDAEGHWCAPRPVRPIGRRVLDDLVEEQSRAGVDLRFVADLATVRAAVLDARLPFSVVRWSDRD